MKLRTLIFLIVILALTQSATLAQKRGKKTVIKLVGTEFYLRNVANGKYLDVPGYANDAKTKNGTKLQLWDLDDGRDRKVKFIPTSGDYFQIRLQHARKNLDVHGCFRGKLFCGTYKTDNGARIQMWNAGTSEPQLWKLEEVNPGQYKIINRYSGKVLDASAGQINKNGCRVQQWEWKGNINQLWELVDVKTGQRYQGNGRS